MRLDPAPVAALAAPPCLTIVSVLSVAHDAMSGARISPAAGFSPPGRSGSPDETLAAHRVHCCENLYRTSVNMLCTMPMTPPLPATSLWRPGPVSVLYGMNGAMARMFFCARRSQTFVLSSTTTLISGILVNPRVALASDFFSPLLCSTQTMRLCSATTSCRGNSFPVGSSSRHIS